MFEAWNGTHHAPETEDRNRNRNDVGLVRKHITPKLPNKFGPSTNASVIKLALDNVKKNKSLKVELLYLMQKQGHDIYSDSFSSCNVKKHNSLVNCSFKNNKLFTTNSILEIPQGL